MYSTGITYIAKDLYRPNEDQGTDHPNERSTPIFVTQRKIQKSSLDRAESNSKAENTLKEERMHFINATYTMRAFLHIFVL